MRPIPLIASLMICVGLCGCKELEDIGILPPPPPPPPPGSLFGIGGTSGVFATTGASAQLVEQLSASSLSRDPTQLGPDPLERSLLQNFDSQRTAFASTIADYDAYLRELLDAAGIRDRSSFFVELDLRANLALGGILGGHAGHDYFSVDGRFVDIANEVSNYSAMADFGRVGEGRDAAIQRIVDCHIGNLGGTIIECYYPAQDLTDDERMVSDVYFSSFIAVMTYHEFAHYYLYHSLDMARSAFDLTGAILFTSANEDDADFVAGALAAKAGLDSAFGQLAYDVLFYYANAQVGAVSSFSDVVTNPALQLYQSSANYSSLAVRKQNYQRGFDAYRYADRGRPPDRTAAATTSANRAASSAGDQA